MAFARIILFGSGLDKLRKVSAELRQSCRSGERFVESEECENDIRANFLEPFVLRTEIGRPMANAHFIACDREVPEYQIVIRILRVNESFEPAGMLESVRQRVSDDGDVVSRLQLKFFDRIVERRI